MRGRTLGVAVALALLSSLVFANVAVAEDPAPSAPPSLADKMKDPNFTEWAPTGTPLPESEMTRVAFSKEWVLKNDADLDPRYVKITFPELLLSSPTAFASGEDTVVLRVPTRLFKDHNTSEKAGEITVSFAARHFEGLPMMDSSLGQMVGDALEGHGSQQRRGDIVHQSRRIYKHQPGEDDITGALGFVSPYYYHAHEGETFFTYHEIEFQGSSSGDWVEIISQMEHVEEWTRVFFCFEIDGDYYYPEDLTVNVDIGDEVYYEHYIDYDPEEGEYYIMGWLEYDGDWFWGLMYDETPPEHYNRFNGSSELDPKGDIEEDFRVRSSLTIDQLRVDDDWEPPSYVEDALYYYGYVQDDYVSVSKLLDESGLRVICTTRDDP